MKRDRAFYGLGPPKFPPSPLQIAEPGEHTLCAKCMLDRTVERLGRVLTFAGPAAVPLQFVSPAAFVVRLVHADGRAAAEPGRVAGRDRRYEALGRGHARWPRENWGSRRKS